MKGGSPRLPELACLETRGRRTLRDDPITPPFFLSLYNSHFWAGAGRSRRKSFSLPPWTRPKVLSDLEKGRTGLLAASFPEHLASRRAGVLRSAERGWREIEAKRPPLPLRVRSFQGRARLGDRTRPLDARLAKGVPEGLYRLKGRTELGGSLGQAGAGGRSFFFGHLAVPPP